MTTTQTTIPTTATRYQAPMTPAAAARRRRFLTVTVANERARFADFAAHGLELDQHAVDTFHRQVMALEALGGPLEA